MRPRAPAAALSRAEAQHQAGTLRLFELLPDGEAGIVWRTIANPLASSDTLLILADALRTGDDPDRHALADAIAALAPIRAAPAPMKVATE